MGNSASSEAAPRPAGADACPVLSASSAQQQQEQQGEQQSRCPVPQSARARAIYNVYGERIDLPSAGGGADPLAALRDSDVLDPKNNMPLAANQQPCPGQRRLLSTDRIESNIPKGGTDATWVYPSPQMFYNALKRKGKGQDVREEDMDSVVRAHNTMNEVTWKRVMDWEQLHCETCSYPTLLKFQGKPHDLSPLARIRGWLGGALPFDRHDWVVDRCGREVRYVIDFYYDEDKAGTPEAFEVVTRPALDSPGAALDRMKMAVYAQFAAWGLPCPITGHPNSGKFGGGAAGEAGQQQQGGDGGVTAGVRAAA
ncbi:cytochrome c heme lyase [Raphidocelis subcapitata]|uniref:Holocytochrome c-type synthase n=1 Tax=Raphidocelis subcapitata TaxID=307507 RepID=A0A2V0NPH0_9CHLO|nr:cytochrome c heme lyase [Raphidocelis subcapitata]|eukprot:GBF89496.1 cytochrome c heme lyase [Raphidocelis subcapitata]